MLQHDSFLGVTLALSLLSVAASGITSPARAEQAPSLDLANGTVTLTPYVFNQFELGGAWGPGENPTGGFNVSYFRYGVAAKLPHDLRVRVIWDFGNPGYAYPQYRDTGLYEAAARYTGWKPFTITVGAFKPNLTLAGSEREADGLFLANPAVINLIGNPFINGGQVGLQVSANGSRWFLDAALIGAHVGQSSTTRQRALLTRAAGLVVQTESLSVHLGFSNLWTFRTPQEAGSMPGISYSVTPEYYIQSQSILNTNQIPARSIWSAGPEFGLTKGPLWVEAEWYHTLVDRTDGPNPQFTGWYAQAGWAVLGKPRKWRPSAADWGAVTPREGFDPAHGHWGALELGARFSTANYDSGSIQGGRQSVWTGGVNWWPVSPLRVSAQWQHSHIELAGSSHDFQTVLLMFQVFLH